MDNPAIAESVNTTHATAANHSYSAPEASAEMIALGLIILASHLGGRLCRRFKLSEVTGQLLGGALAGPYALGIMGLLPRGGAYDDALHAFHFFVFVFLSMVAFGIGEELHIARLKRVGRAVLGITLVQGITTWALISAGFIFIAKLPVMEALLIGSIGIASAPAVTFVLMNKLRVEGRLRHILGGIVVLADLAEVLVFSFLVQYMMQTINSRGGEHDGTAIAITVLEEVGLAVLIGGGIYFALRVLVRRHASKIEGDDEHGESDTPFLHRILGEHPSPSAEILMVVMGTVAIGAGIAYHEQLPFLITAIVAGFMVANFHSHAIFDSLKIDNISAMLNLGFFALIGASISLDTLGSSTAWFAGLYIVTRLTGKLLGTWLGAVVMGEDRKVKACIPFLLLPQAGVGAVEAVYATTVLNEPVISATILPAIVFFEVVGVFMVDRSLRKWRSWVTDEEKAMKQAANRSSQAEAAGKLRALLTPDFVRTSLKSDDKNGLIEEMVDIARKYTEQHIDRAQALQLLGERERLAPTGFGNGIAIPHCRLMGLDNPVLVFGKSEKGVVFGGVDNEPCHLILMILSSARDPAEHLKLLAASAHVLGDEKVRGDFNAANSPEEVIKIMETLASTPKTD